MNKYVFLALVLFYGCATNNKKQTKDTDAEQAVVTVPTENQAEENPSYISDEPILLTEDKDSLVLKVYFGIMLRHKNLSGINYSYLRDIERALSAYIDKGFKRIDHFSDPLEREFALDTFRINETCRIFPPEDADEPAIHRKVFAYKRMAESDITVIVEGLTEHDINLSRYSLSTKAADALASGANILTYGSLESGIIDYMQSTEASVVCTRKEDLAESIKRLMADTDLQKRYYDQAIVMTEKHHNRRASCTVSEGVIKKAIKHMKQGEKSK